jgi:catechol 2,3-dioxygenase-like lactoylglutathione lyase family enzyme
MRFNHLGITVADQERSRRFYETYFGFDAGPAQRYDDGVLIIRNADGFDLALESGTDTTRPSFLHFGFRLDSPDAARALLTRMRAGGPDERVTIVETEDDPAYVGFKCLDPDGYTVEVYWESADDQSSPASEQK